MDALPSNMDLINDQTKLDLSSGLSEINYIFGNTQPPTQPPTTIPEQPNNDINTIILAGASVAAAISGVAIMN